MLLWGSDHPGWNRVGKAGAYGSTTGVGMCLAGGGYLGRLRQKGWSYRSGDFLENHNISAAGNLELDAWRKPTT
jgi:hypothetical protein